MFPPLHSLALFNSYEAVALYTRLRLTNEAVALLLKTMAVTKMSLSLSFLLPTLFHPHGRWTEVKAKLCFLTAYLLQCCLCICAYEKFWVFLVLFYDRTGTVKAACSSAEVCFSSLLSLHGEMGVRGRGE